MAGNGATQQDPLITFTDLPLEGYSTMTYNLVLMFETAEVLGSPRLELA